MVQTLLYCARILMSCHVPMSCFIAFSLSAFTSEHAFFSFYLSHTLNIDQFTHCVLFFIFFVFILFSNRFAAIILHISIILIFEVLVNHFATFQVFTVAIFKSISVTSLSVHRRVFRSGDPYVRRGNLKIVKILVIFEEMTNRGTKIDDVDNRGNSVVHSVAKYGSLEILHFLRLRFLCY